jgi:hypothetical protein
MRARLVEATDELKSRLEREKRTKELLFRLARETRWQDLPLETLEAVAAILDKAKGK